MFVFILHISSMYCFSIEPKKQSCLPYKMGMFLASCGVLISLSNYLRFRQNLQSVQFICLNVQNFVNLPKGPFGNCLNVLELLALGVALNLEFRKEERLHVGDGPRCLTSDKGIVERRCIPPNNKKYIFYKR